MHEIQRNISKPPSIPPWTSRGRENPRGGKILGEGKSSGRENPRGGKILGRENPRGGKILPFAERRGRVQAKRRTQGMHENQRNTQTTHHPIIPIIPNHPHPSSNHPTTTLPLPSQQHPLPQHPSPLLAAAPSQATTVPSPASHFPPLPRGRFRGGPRVRATGGQGAQTIQNPNHLQRNTHTPTPPHPSNPSSSNIPQRCLRQQSRARLTLPLGRLVDDCQHSRRQADVYSDSFARQL